MPSLLEKGKVVKASHMSTKTKRMVDNMTGIDFLISYIEDRVWADKNTPPVVKIKGIGGKVLVLRSGTGSGKSTLLPPGLYNKFFENKRRNIICTQPSVATATDIPYQIIEWNPNLKLGENIGFQTGGLTWKPVKGILFATVGILLQHLKILTDDEFMSKYSFIIIDEVHARSMDVDSVLFYLKRLLERNWDIPDCPMIILMSATIDPKVFMTYFNCPRANFLDVEGATFPIKDNFFRFDLTDYITYTVDLTEKLHVDNIADVTTKPTDFRDILIFAQGGAQIKEINKRIHRLNAGVFSKGVIEAKIHSDKQWEKYTGGGVSDAYYLAPIIAMSANIQQGGKEYKDLFSNIDSVTVDIYEFDEMGEMGEVIDTVAASRRVIMGTNAIETGITIDTLGYCIDMGWVKESSFNPNFGCSLLTDKAVTQASSQQRRGRVGRKADGKFFAAYTKDTKDKMQPLPHPDIVKEDISAFLLGAIVAETKTEITEISESDRKLTSFQMNQFDQLWYDLTRKEDFIASKLDFIQYPSADSMSFGLNKLYKLGLIDWEYNPTIFGYFATKFRKVSLENIRMILAGFHEGANVLDLITIACANQVGFKLGINKRKYIPRNPLNVSDTEAFYYYKMLVMDEFIEYLFIWNDFMKAIDQIGDQVEKSSIRTNNTSLSNEYLELWAKKNNLKLDALFAVVENRDEVIGDMINMGLNPYYNGLNLRHGIYNLTDILNRNLQEGVDEIQKLKRCIYEGYRNNLLIYNSVLRSYIWQASDVPVVIDSKLIKPFKQSDDDIVQKIPHNLVVSAITIMPSFSKPGTFEFTGGDISVLDGYVDLT
jgi:hypothetical protein